MPAKQLNPMGFGRQPSTGGLCGVYALTHAMLLIGRTGTIDEYIKLTDYISISNSIKENVELKDLLSISNALSKISSGYGTAQRGILQAIKKIGFKYVKLEERSEKTSQIILDKYLSERIPLILFVNWDKTPTDQAHWFVCAGRKEKKYLIVDSSPLSNDKNIFSFYSWEELSRRFVFYSADVKHFQLIGLAIKPSNGISAVSKIPNLINKLNDDEEFRKSWGYYVNDLMKVFNSSKLSDDRLSSKEFFNEYSSKFINAANEMGDDYSLKNIKNELLNYRLISNTYSLSVNKTKLSQALITFTALLIKKLRNK